MIIDVPDKIKDNVQKCKYSLGNDVFSYKFSLDRSFIKDNIPCGDETEIVNRVEQSPYSLSKAHYDLNVVYVEKNGDELRLICFPTRNGMQCPRALSRFNVPVRCEKYVFESERSSCVFNYHFKGYNYCFISIIYNVEEKRLMAVAHIADADGKIFDSTNILLPRMFEERVYAYCDGFLEKPFRENLLYACA